MKGSLVKPIDGIISRYLNQRLSMPLSRLIVARGWPISPDTMSLISFGIGVLAGALFALHVAPPAAALSLGSLALIGAYGVSYSLATACAHGYYDFPRLIAGRDARLFLIMLAGIAAAFAPAALLYALGLLALISWSELSWRLIRIWHSD